jgi:hypothetical protein
VEEVLSSPIPNETMKKMGFHL